MTNLDVYLTEKCRHIVQMQQELQYRDKKYSELQKQLLEQSQRLEAQVQEGTKTAAVGKDRMSAEDKVKLERELKEVKAKFYLIQQSLEQRLAATQKLADEKQMREVEKAAPIQELAAEKQAMSRELQAARQELTAEQYARIRETGLLRQGIERLNAQQERLRVDKQTLQLRVDAKLQKHPQSVSDSTDISAWKVPRSEIQVMNEIGVGAWGTVARGMYSGQLVAVKWAHPLILDQHTVERLERETRMMTQVRHPNLVQIIAAVFDEESRTLRAPPMIITELLDLNLRECYQRGMLQETSRIPVFLDVAYGLHYLHNCQEPIIHRDVSAPNVLLQALPNGMWRAKVSDFGSANLARLSQTAGEGAIIYTPQKPFLKRTLTHRAYPTPPRSTCSAMASSCVRCSLQSSQTPSSTWRGWSRPSVSLPPSTASSSPALTPAQTSDPPWPALSISRSK